jgi:hypothetical protein
MVELLGILCTEADMGGLPVLAVAGKSSVGTPRNMSRIRIRSVVDVVGCLMVSCRWTRLDVHVNKELFPSVAN